MKNLLITLALLVWLFVGVQLWIWDWGGRYTLPGSPAYRQRVREEDLPRWGLPDSLERLMIQYINSLPDTAEDTPLAITDTLNRPENWE